jgi:hypothetical protein
MSSPVSDTRLRVGWSSSWQVPHSSALRRKSLCAEVWRMLVAGSLRGPRRGGAMPSGPSLKYSSPLRPAMPSGAGTARWHVSQCTPSRSPAARSNIRVAAWPLVNAVGEWQRKHRWLMPGASCSATETVARKSGSRAALASIDGAQVSYAAYDSPDGGGEPAVAGATRRCRREGMGEGVGLGAPRGLP